MRRAIQAGAAVRLIVGRNWMPLLSRHSVVLHGFVALALFAGMLARFDDARARVGFHGDESNSIKAGQYFGYLFLDRDPWHEAWGRSNPTLTHPMGYRHVVGLTLWLHGHDLKSVNNWYDYGADRETNRLNGRVPSGEVLDDARSASVLFAAGVVALLYVLAVQLGAPLAGLAAALAVAAAPYAALHLVRAKSDSAFAFFMLLGLVLCLRAFGSRDFSTRSAATVGLVLGLALSMKLTAILSLPVLGLACLLSALPRTTGPRPAGLSVRPLVCGCVAVAACFAVFVALNPFLWPDPVGRTVAQFEFRRDEMLGQQRRRPADAVHDLTDRAERVLGNALVKQTSSRIFTGVPLDVPFAAVGLTWLAAVARREWLRGRQVGPAALFLLWGFSYLAGTVSGYLIDYNRYVMPVFLLAALASGIGLRVALRRALHVWTRRVAPTFRARHGTPAREVSAAQHG
jgi:hypothetical protein